jgi:hypothetical protein
MSIRSDDKTTRRHLVPSRDRVFIAFFRPFPPRNYFRQLFTASPPKVKVFMVHFQTRNKANFPGPDHPEKSPEFD